MFSKSSLKGQNIDALNVAVQINMFTEHLHNLCVHIL